MDRNLLLLGKTLSFTHQHYHKSLFLSHRVLCILVTMVTDYCQTADDLPMLITDILGRLVDLLKVYDSTHNITRGHTLSSF